MEEILTKSLTEIVEGIKNGTYTSTQVTQACIQQIEKTKEYNTLNHTNFEDALRQAKEIDERIAQGNTNGLLLGAPIVVKDNMCTYILPTTCSSKILENFVAPYEATVVSKLRAEGAVILGKANMDEFAMGSSNETSAYGKVLNPCNTSRVPGGSSGGSAACVCAHQCFGALGTDTGGSIRQPASFCGVVGLKPTYGEVSRRGVVAFASSLDQVGPMAKNVADTALLFDAIRGYDAKDSTSSNHKRTPTAGKFLKTLKGLRIGLVKEIFEQPMNDDVRQALEKAISFYKLSGVEFVDVSIPNIAQAIDMYYILSSAEAASNLARFDGIKYGRRAPEAQTVEEIYTLSRSQGFGDEVKRRIMLGNYVLSSGYFDAYYKKATLCQEVLKQQFAKAFEMCDALITPTSPTVAFPFGSKATPLEMYLSDIYTVPVNIFGGPAISFPCGKGEDNMPIGLQLIGNYFEEQTLLQLAEFYEREAK